MRVTLALSLCLVVSAFRAPSAQANGFASFSGIATLRATSRGEVVLSGRRMLLVLQRDTLAHWLASARARLATLDRPDPPPNFRLDSLLDGSGSALVIVGVLGEGRIQSVFVAERGCRPDEVTRTTSSRSALLELLAQMDSILAAPGSRGPRTVVPSDISCAPRQLRDSTTVDESPPIGWVLVNREGRAVPSTFVSADPHASARSARSTSLARLRFDPARRGRLFVPAWAPVYLPSGNSRPRSAITFERTSDPQLLRVRIEGLRAYDTSEKYNPSMKQLGAAPRMYDIFARSDLHALMLAIAGARSRVRPIIVHQGSTWAGSGIDERGIRFDENAGTAPGNVWVNNCDGTSHLELMGPAVISLDTIARPPSSPPSRLTRGTLSERQVACRPQPLADYPVLSAHSRRERSIVVTFDVDSSGHPNLASLRTIPTTTNAIRRQLRSQLSARIYQPATLALVRRSVRLVERAQLVAIADPRWAYATHACARNGRSQLDILAGDSLPRWYLSSLADSSFVHPALAPYMLARETFVVSPVGWRMFRTATPRQGSQRLVPEHDTRVQAPPAGRPIAVAVRYEACHQ